MPNNKWVNGRSATHKILKGDGFFISYNANPGGDIQLFSGDGGSDETALVKGGQFFILNGDFREKYEPLVDKGFEACLAFYENNKKEFASSWSEG